MQPLGRIVADDKSGSLPRLSRAPTTGCFDTMTLQAGEPGRRRSLEATIDLLAQLIGDLTARDGWQPRRLHVFGFSQGGTAALHLIAQLRWVL